MNSFRRFFPPVVIAVRCCCRHRRHRCCFFPFACVCVDARMFLVLFHVILFCSYSNSCVHRLFPPALHQGIWFLACVCVQCACCIVFTFGCIKIFSFFCFVYLFFWNCIRVMFSHQFHVVVSFHTFVSVPFSLRLQNYSHFRTLFHICSNL